MLQRVRRVHSLGGIGVAVSKNTFFIVHDIQSEVEADEQTGAETWSDISKQILNSKKERYSALKERLSKYAKEMDLKPEKVNQFVLDMINQSEFDFAKSFPDQKELDQELKKIKPLLKRRPLRVMYTEQVKHLMYLIAKQDNYQLGRLDDGRNVSSYCFRYNYQDENDELMPEDIETIQQEVESHRRNNLRLTTRTKYDRVSDKESAIIVERIYKFYYLNFGSLPSFTQTETRGVGGKGVILLDVINDFFNYNVKKESMYNYRDTANKEKETYIRNEWFD